MFIQTEQTPNPQTLKFLPGKVVMEEGTAFFQNIDESSNSPFAKRLFNIENVHGVFFGSDFITITKNDTQINIDIDLTDRIAPGTIFIPQYYDSSVVLELFDHNQENQTELQLNSSS